MQKLATPLKVWFATVRESLGNASLQSFGNGRLALASFVAIDWIFGDKNQWLSPKSMKVRARKKLFHRLLSFDTTIILSWIGCFMITYAACLRLSCHHTSHKFRGTSFELFLPHCQILNTSPFWRHRHTAQQFRPLCLPRDPRNHEPELWMWFRYFLSLTKVEIYLVSFSFQMKYVEVL